VDSRTSDVSIFKCSGGVHLILVMFDVMTLFVMLYIDMLDCYVYAAFSIIMYMLHFLYAGEADKIDKKNSYVHELTDIHNLCSSVGRGT
jgi:hypothetical protein